MITVDTAAKVRRLYFLEKRSIKSIARSVNLARNTVRTIVRSPDETERHYERRQQPQPPPPILTPERLTLSVPPIADCGRYDSLRSMEAANGTL